MPVSKTSPKEESVGNKPETKKKWGSWPASLCAVVYCFVLQGKWFGPREDREDSEILPCRVPIQNPQTTTNYNAHLYNHPRFQVITARNLKQRGKT